jgi:YfiH family protein
VSSLQFIRSSLLDVDGVAHGFTTRPGGVSEGPYDSLNLTRSRGDAAEHVSENRRRVRTALGVDHLVFATQVHGNNVLRIDAAAKGEQPAGEGDALMTDQPGLGLACQTADCTPILLFDPSNRAIAAIHSGWRSTVLNVIGQTVNAMAIAFGTTPASLIAAIGPSISAKNYRVGSEVADQFERQFSEVTGPRDSTGGVQLDVGAACHQQLLDAGVADTKITRSPICTYDAESTLFSARRAHHQGQSGVFGGQAGIIALL